jgi:catechol 2,3-dioxygenase-like lactoylglutathione lyase family enzyme
MLDHVSVGARDIAFMRAFYLRVLAEVGLRVVDEQSDRFVDFGDGEQTGVEFSLETPVDGRPASAGNGVHIAFAVKAKGAVEAFYATALAMGGSCAGEPGMRPHYGPDYYSAFVFDPEGNKIEAVWCLRRSP